MILDGGGGRLAVTFVRDGESYVGAVDRSVLERVLGLPLDLHDLVAALLTGESPSAVERVERRGARPGVLPQALSITSPEARLELELRRLSPLETDPSQLGCGCPPAGTRVRPIEELGAQWERLEQLAAEDGGQ